MGIHIVVNRIWSISMVRTVKKRASRSVQEKTVAKAGITNPAALLALMRKKHDHVCAWGPCSKAFRGINTAKFCSNACRQANKYSKVKTMKATAVATSAADQKVATDSISVPTKRRRIVRRGRQAA